MNKSTTIVEGGISRKITPVNKVKVKNSGSGKSMWIPEDAKPVRSLSVTKNGFYYAVNDGYTAYDQVTVNVSSEAEVSLEDLLDDLGLGDLSDIGDLGSIGVHSLDDLKDIADLSDEDMKDIEDAAMNGTDKVKGIDPDTEELHEISKDAEGNLTESRLPDAINIVIPPNRTVYHDGDSIDFTGIKVYAMCGGQCWTNEHYPTGEIPFEELIFPVTIAEFDDEVSTGNSLSFEYHLIVQTLDGINDYENDFIVTSSLAQIKAICYSSDWEIIPSNGMYSKSYLVIAASTEHFTANIRRNGVDNYLSSDNCEGGQYKYFTHSHNVPAENRDKYTSTGPGGSGSTNISGDEIKAIAESLLSGDYEGTQTIPVHWMYGDLEITDGEYTGGAYEDSFTITEGDWDGNSSGGSDPFVGYSDVSYGGHFYNINKKKVPAIHYSNGYAWQEGISAEFTTEQAIEMGWLILLR